MSHTATTTGSAGPAGAARSVAASIAAPRPAIRHGRPRVRECDRDRCERECLERETRRHGVDEDAGGRDGALDALEIERWRDPLAEGELDAAQAGDDSSDGDRGEGLGRPAYCARHPGHHERHEREQADGGERGSGEEREAPARVAPRQRQPAEREHAVEDREPECVVAERQDRRGEREREPGPRHLERGERGHGRERGRPAGRIEGKRGRADEGGDAGERGRRRALGQRVRRDPLDRRRTLAAGERGPQLLRQRGRGRPLGRVVRECVRDRAEQPLRQVGTLGLQRWAAGLDRPRHLRQRHAPERMLARERFPEQDPDRPDVARRAGLLAAEALRGDVGERAGDVADGGQRLGLVELGESEVEQPHRDAVVLGEEHVRRLDVAMDDPAAVRVREPVEDLGRGLDGLAVPQLAAAHRVAQGDAADVLVGDVDVTGVGAEAVRAQAALVPEPRGGLGLALGAVCGLPLPGDDLEGDVEAVSLVAGEPDRAGAAAAERAQRAVAVEDELPARERMSGGGHVVSRVGRRNSVSCRCHRAVTTEAAVTVASFHACHEQSRH